MSARVQIEGREPGLQAGLSPTDHRMLERLADGCTNAAIARQLGRSEKTVRNRLTVVYRKLRVNNRAAAVAVWMRHHGGHEWKRG